MKCPKCKKSLFIAIATEGGRNRAICDNTKCEYYGILRLVNPEHIKKR